MVCIWIIYGQPLDMVGFPLISIVIFHTDVNLYQRVAYLESNATLGIQHDFRNPKSACLVGSSPSPEASLEDFEGQSRHKTWS